ncbi:MAG: electron transfer flavoprotein subunit beta/FixA family protein [Desulfohalobiaceae bacterium]|nr:electron transfer flavoprotein subunit beta/FixA family protein [Desulfohalobiaceae bacterium]
MHIVCLLKQVPDTAEVRIDPETNTLIRAGVESILNPYDMVAVEQAVRLREQHGGMVSAVTMGPPQAEAILRDALALGADQVYLLSDRAFAGADTLATSYTLFKAVQKLDGQQAVDLVLCGKQAIDGDTAQTGPGVATRMGCSQLTYCQEVDWVDPKARTIQIKRKLRDGFERLRAGLPALLTAELELATPRRCSLPSLIRSLQAEIPVWDADSMGADRELLGLKGSPTWVQAIFSPQPKEPGPQFQAGEDSSRAVSEALEALFRDEDFAEKLLKH